MKKLLLSSAVLAILAGICMVIGGSWGIWFTYSNVARENITTPADASIPNAPVRGPLTLKAQADIIRFHTLRSTEGKTYAEMDSKIPKLDQNNQPILNASGTPEMISNPNRAIWITATTLTTALNLGIITYAFSALIIFFGFVSIWTGITFFALSRKY